MMRESDIRWLKRDVLPIIKEVKIKLEMGNTSGLADKLEFLCHDILVRIGE